MKTIFSISALAVLVTAVPNPCFAVWFVVPVSKERAKELNMEVEAKPAGPEYVWVKVEFEPKGDLKKFSGDSKKYSQVQLRIGDEERQTGNEDKYLVIAPLWETRTKEGHVVVHFRADRGHLDRVRLWVMVADAIPGGRAYVLRMDEFVDLESLRKAK